MIKSLKGIVGSISNKIQTVVHNARKGFGSSNLIVSAQSNPELIQSVMNELKQHDNNLMLTRLQELEKAIYHLAARQKEIIERQEALEQLVVAMHTTLEEMFNGMGSEDEDFLWEAKKGASPLN